MWCQVHITCSFTCRFSIVVSARHHWFGDFFSSSLGLGTSSWVPFEFLRRFHFWGQHLGSPQRWRHLRLFPASIFPRRSENWVGQFRTKRCTAPWIACRFRMFFDVFCLAKQIGPTKCTAHGRRTAARRETMESSHWYNRRFCDRSTLDISDQTHSKALPVLEQSLLSLPGTQRLRLQQDIKTVLKLRLQQKTTLKEWPKLQELSFDSSNLHALAWKHISKLQSPTIDSSAGNHQPLTSERIKPVLTSQIMGSYQNLCQPRVAYIRNWQIGRWYHQETFGWFQPPKSWNQTAFEASKGEIPLNWSNNNLYIYIW